MFYFQHRSGVSDFDYTQFKESYEEKSWKVSFQVYSRKIGSRRDSFLFVFKVRHKSVWKQLCPYFRFTLCCCDTLPAQGPDAVLALHLHVATDTFQARLQDSPEALFSSQVDHSRDFFLVVELPQGGVILKSILSFFRCLVANLTLIMLPVCWSH